MDKIFFFLMVMILGLQFDCLDLIWKNIKKNTRAIDNCASALTAIALKDVGISCILGQSVDGSFTNSFIHSIKLK